MKKNKESIKQTDPETKAQLAKIKKLLNAKAPDAVQFAYSLLQTLEIRDADFLDILSPARAFNLMNSCDTGIWVSSIKYVERMPRSRKRLLDAAVRVFDDKRLDSDWMPPNSKIEKCNDLLTGLLASEDESIIGFWASAWGKRKAEIFDKNISVRQAKGLAKLRGSLWLANLEKVSDEIALVLSSCKCKLSISGDAPIGDSPAQIALLKKLVKSDALQVSSMLTIQHLRIPEVVQLLAQSPSIHIDIEELSDETVAAMLPKHFESIYLHYVKRISPAVAAALGYGSDDLRLGLEVMNDEAVARGLSQNKGQLCLDDVTDISDAVAVALAEHTGTLYLRSLTSLSDAAAQALARHKGTLNLDGLTSLSDAAAQALAQHKGDLSLGIRLTSLSDAAAQALAQKKGNLWLEGEAEKAVKRARKLLAADKKKAATKKPKAKP
jgi:hypothetical protein